MGGAKSGKIENIKKGPKWKNFQKKKKSFWPKMGGLLKTKVKLQGQKWKIKKKTSLRAKNGKIENIKKRMGD